MSKQKKEKKGLKKLRYKYKLVLLNEDNFEQRFSLRLSRLNVYLTFLLISFFWVALMVYLLAFTSLREYIPGYSDPELRQKIFSMEYQLDSLQLELLRNDIYVNSIKRILSGDEIIDQSENNIDSNYTSEKIVPVAPSKEDSILRQELENAEQYNIYYFEADEVYNEQFSSGAKVYFNPLNGLITNYFDAENGHFGIDIVSTKNDVIKNIDDGMVIFAEWTLNSGYVLLIQHSPNVVSVYKHNSFLLKKVGDYTKAGDLIAIVGNTGEQSSGPHLHFELWIDGKAVNPTDYISF